MMKVKFNLSIDSTVKGMAKELAEADNLWPSLYIERLIRERYRKWKGGGKP